LPKIFARWGWLKAFFGMWEKLCHSNPPNILMVNRKPNTKGDDWGMVYCCFTLPQFWGNDDNSLLIPFGVPII
jgi:hypothetical protein